MLSGFEVLPVNDDFGLHRDIGAYRGVSLWCFDDNHGPQVVLVLITPDALQACFKRDVDRAEANLLVARNLPAIIGLIVGKYQSQNVVRHTTSDGRSYPLVSIGDRDVQENPPEEMDGEPSRVGWPESRHR